MLRYLALLLFVFAAVPAAAQSAFTSERISVEVRGSGPDVVLIPGLSSHPQVWESTIAALPNYRYHLVHVAGFAGRPPQANATGPVLVPVAEEIARYIRETGLERPAIVGHSMGGSWAMLVAGRNPGLVSRVMVVDMMPFLGAMFGGPTATAASLRPIAEQIRAAMSTATAEARRQQIEQTIAGMVRTEALRPRVIEQSLASHSPTSAQGFYDLVTTDLRPEVARITVPFTVLWVQPPGAPVTVEQMTGYYAASYAGAPHAVVRQIPDSYHFIMFDQPEVFQTILREFLAAS
ncbi:MAG: alpha/beta fold hydrolase [Sphingosinicella sp.]|uniref:alpha/beta fold hydrolase n=1 Tax=Sphingosinicella sp. TaxID=1917971 RepID=UPI004037C974